MHQSHGPFAITKGPNDHHNHDHERFIHRLESFSDTVIGFSLALLTLTLAMPRHTADLFAHPMWLAVYFWTFALIVGLWLRHQKLFSAYFVPTPVAVVVNFVVLACIGLLVFFLQVFGRVQGDADRAQAFDATFLP